MQQQFGVPVPVFLHIPKCGGRTLIDIMYREYWKDRDHIVKTKGHFDGGQFVNDTALPDFRPSIVMGHMFYGIGKWPTAYFTMLREPIDRTMSQYNHFLRVEDHPMHNAAKCGPLYFFQYASCTLVDNIMTRMISGCNPPYRGCTPEMIERAKRHLESMTFGLLERYDESLMLFQERFRWREPIYVRLNTGIYDIGFEDLDERSEDLVYEMNALDIDLYEHASQLFEERSRCVSKRAAAFQLRNEEMRPAVVWSRRKHRIKQLVRRIYG